MPAFLLNPLIRYAVIAVIAVIIAALTGWAIWERHDAQAAAKGEAAARLESDLHAADAARWQAASDVRDGAIAILNGTLTKQNAAVEATRLDNAKLATVNARYAAELRAARDAAQSQEQETRNDARQRPTEVHHLGAVACTQYRRMYGPATACTDTQSAAAN